MKHLRFFLISGTLALIGATAWAAPVPTPPATMPADQLPPPPYHLTTVKWVVDTRNDLQQDDIYVSLIGYVTGKEGDETYFFSDGTGTVRLDSEKFELPIGKRLLIGGRIDQAYFGFGHLEVDVQHWKYAKPLKTKKR